MESLAVNYAGELARWGIETTIVVPGVFSKGTNHFINSGRPHDTTRAAEYATGPYHDMEELVHKGHEIVQPPDADVREVAAAVDRVVNLPFGSRPFRVTIDPADGGSEVVSMMADRVRRELFLRTGLEDLLTPHFKE